MNAFSRLALESTSFHPLARYSLSLASTMSSPQTPGSTQRSKRRRSNDTVTPGAAGPSNTHSSPPPSSLPPSSPPAPFTDFDSEIEDEDEDARERGRLDLPDDESEGEGEDLFNDETITRDYEDNPELDTYDAAGIDDRESLPDMTRAERLAAEREMRRRDRGLPGTRAAGRERMPGFLQSDDEDDGETGALAGINTRRTRRQYDERMDEDDVVEDVSVFWVSRSETRVR